MQSKASLDISDQSARRPATAKAAVCSLVRYLIRPVNSYIDRPIEHRPGVDRTTDGLKDHGCRGNVPSLKRLIEYRPVALDRLRCTVVLGFAIVVRNLAPDIAFFHLLKTER